MIRKLEAFFKRIKQRKLLVFEPHQSWVRIKDIRGEGGRTNKSSLSSDKETVLLREYLLNLPICQQLFEVRQNFFKLDFKVSETSKVVHEIVHLRREKTYIDHFIFDQVKACM